MKYLYVYLVIIFTLLTNGFAFSDDYEQTIESYLNELTHGTSSFLIEKGKSKNLYLPRKAVDNDINTAWVEGKDDDGIGEFFIVNITMMRIANTLKILPGFVRNKSLYESNNRPKDIQLVIFQCSDNIFQSLKASKDIFNKEVKILYNINHKIIDTPEYQTINLPDYNPHYDKYPDIRMAIIINSIYKGSKHRDTCISELRFFDKNGIDIIKSRIDNMILKNKGASQ